MNKSFLKYNDMMGYELKLKSKPKRIISIVPSQTLLLFDLGLGDYVVGKTKFCIHPKTKTEIVGGTKTIHFERIAKLKPDIIIANKEENTKEMIEELRKNYNVWVSDIETIEDSYKMIDSLGKIFEVEEKANEIINKTKINLESIKNPLKTTNKVLYLIWQNPYMAVANHTFIHHIIKLIGFENVLNNKSRYPILYENEIKELNPDFVFLSSEPFPFIEKHIEQLSKILPNSKILLVDGEYFSWYGSHLVNSHLYFRSLINKILKWV